MKNDLGERLSAYLDQELAPDERAELEQVLSRDPEARAELEYLRATRSWIDQAAPAIVLPPPDLADRILARLDAPGGGPETGATGGASGVGPAAVWWVAGGLLAGLLGTLVALDRNQSRPPKPAAGYEDLPGTAGEAATKTVPVPSVTAPADAAADIHGGRTLTRDTRQELSGPVLVRGRGIDGSGSGNFPGLANPFSGTSEAREIEFSERRVSLESVTGWTLNRIRTALSRGGRFPTAEADAVWQIAQKFNLNPGLLIASRADLPDRSWVELGGELRRGLELSPGAPLDRRLADLARQLNAPSGAAERWRRQLKE